MLGKLKWEDIMSGKTQQFEDLGDGRVKFAGITYRHEKTVHTIMTDEYVPDWTITEAIRESFQNMFDEGLQENVATYPSLTEDHAIYARDTGRGVSFEDILLLGVSGKRDDPRAVGKHGEGEVVSFMVAARNSVLKVMASQSWLATAHLDPFEDTAHQVLVFEVYRVEKAPKGVPPGTRWYYRGEGYAVEAAYDRVLFNFARHPGNRLAKIAVVKEAMSRGQSEKEAEATAKKVLNMRRLSTPGGNLFSRGSKVGTLWDLTLSYNLDAQPGRDRTGFDWEQVRGECARIFEEHVTPVMLLQVLERVHNYGTGGCREMEFINVVLTPSRVRAALALAHKEGFKKVVWEWDDREHAAIIADAKAQNMLVLRFNEDGMAVPNWVRANVPEAQTVVKARSLRIVKLPSEVLTAAKALFAGMLGDNRVSVLGGQLDNAAMGTGDFASQTIVLDVKRVKEYCDTWQEFVSLIVHETAHVVTGADDCTRQHTTGCTELAAKLLDKVMCDGYVFQLIMDAKTAYETWQAS